MDYSGGINSSQGSLQEGRGVKKRISGRLMKGDRHLASHTSFKDGRRSQIWDGRHPVQDGKGKEMDLSPRTFKRITVMLTDGFWPSKTHQTSDPKNYTIIFDTELPSLAQ